MSFVDIFTEQMLLMMIKAMTESFSEPMENEMKSELQKVGIEADVNIDIKVLSVNPDTFLEAYKKKESV